MPQATMKDMTGRTLKGPRIKRKMIVKQEYAP